jgi:hypothetical protein
MLDSNRLAIFVRDQRQERLRVMIRSEQVIERKWLILELPVKSHRQPLLSTKRIVKCQSAFRIFEGMAIEIPGGLRRSSLLKGPRVAGFEPGIGDVCMALSTFLPTDKFAQARFFWMRFL